MKKLIAIVCLTLATTSVFAQVRCEPSPRGGTCCWDIRADGPFRPVGCQKENILYVIYNEDKEKMRIVGRREEARQIVSSRDGWTFVCVKNPKPIPDLSTLEEAPF